MFLSIGAPVIIAGGLFVVILYTMAIAFLFKNKANITSFALLLIPVIGPIGIIYGAYQKMMSDIKEKSKQ